MSPSFIIPKITRKVETLVALHLRNHNDINPHLRATVSGLFGRCPSRLGTFDDARSTYGTLRTVQTHKSRTVSSATSRYIVETPVAAAENFREGGAPFPRARRRRSRSQPTARRRWVRRLPDDDRRRRLQERRPLAVNRGRRGPRERHGSMFASPKVDGRRSIFIRNHANDHFRNADQGANVVDDRSTILQSCYSVSLRTMLTLEHCDVRLPHSRAGSRPPGRSQPPQDRPTSR